MLNLCIFLLFIFRLTFFMLWLLVWIQNIFSFYLLWIYFLNEFDIFLSSFFYLQRINSEKRIFYPEFRHDYWFYDKPFLYLYFVDLFIISVFLYLSKAGLKISDLKKWNFKFILQLNSWLILSLNFFLFNLF